MNFFEKLSITEAKNKNAQVLAFVGDAVHTLFVKTKLSMRADVKSGALHKVAQKYVKASAQSFVAHAMEASLSEDELDVFKRARNYKTNSTPKHASLVDYKYATAFEAVVGYLYLTNQTERLQQVLTDSMEQIEKEQA